MTSANRFDAVTRYPLSWPRGWPRTSFRKAAHFGTTASSGVGYASKRRLTIAEAMNRLFGELRRLGTAEIILSTNVQTRLDGLPRSDGRAPTDPGVAVYFQLRRKPTVLACDRWTTVADNIAAIAAHVEAMRAIARYGVGSLEQAFAGYTALPTSTMDWRNVLGLNGDRVTRDQIDARFRELAGRLHPDVGGDHDRMAELNAARAAALVEVLV